MSLRRALLFTLAATLAAAVAAVTARPAAACGGLFCQTTPVDQNAERIIFTDNGDGTLTAIIQIQYTGAAPDFSWVLPLPSPITADAVAVPETAAAAFQELELATAPQFIPPPRPECARQIVFEAASAVADGGVTVFASGEAGPYAFDVVGSDDPEALVTWLRDHDYRVTPEMEPLIDVYVEESFVFLAMQLLPEQGAQDIAPVAVTYASEQPMIPLRLTAVAANPDMAVLVWFFANAQARPDNYAAMEIPDSEIRFTDFGTHNYRQLMGQFADDFSGQAFVTEYAQPTRPEQFFDPFLQQLSIDFSYLTRLNTVISPEEMTVDPTFVYDASLPDVTNVHDLSARRGVFECDRVGRALNTISLPFVGTQSDAAPAAESGPLGLPSRVVDALAGGLIVLAAVLLISWLRARRAG